MTAKRVLMVLIVVTAVVFALVHAASQDYGLAVLAVGLGLGWLVLEVQRQSAFATGFFLAFLVLAIIGGFNHASTPAVLLGLSTDLAAWDISRLRARIAGKTTNEAAALLETRHLQQLAVTAAAGFFIALIPVLIQLSISFVILLLLILLLMIALRQSMMYLRHDRENNG